MCCIWTSGSWNTVYQMDKALLKFVAGQSAVSCCLAAPSTPNVQSPFNYIVLWNCRLPTSGVSHPNWVQPIQYKAPFEIGQWQSTELATDWPPFASILPPAVCQLLAANRGKGCASVELHWFAAASKKEEARFLNMQTWLYTVEKGKGIFEAISLKGMPNVGLLFS